MFGEKNKKEKDLMIGTLRLCDTHREFHDMSANYGNKYYAVIQRQETENRLASTIGQ